MILCPPFRPSLAGDEPWKAVAAEIRQDLVEGWARHAEARRRRADRASIGADAAQHFVAHLHEVARVEELAVEQLVVDRVRARIERPVGAQAVRLDVGLSSRGHVMASFRARSTGLKRVAKYMLI